MLEKEFIQYDRALALKELGFDEPCLAYYNVNNELTFTSIVSQNTNSFWLANPNNITSAPLYQQAFRWFRDKYGLIGHIRESWSFDNTTEYVTQINGTYINHGLPDKPVNRFDTYEEAELACIDKLIELIKEAKEL